MPHPANDTTLEDISHISGNASDDIKRILSNPGRFYRRLQLLENTPPMFGDSIQTHMVVTEISINNKAEEPKKVEGRVVLELDVAEGMGVLTCSVINWALI
jgi:acyl-coenzyme A thioesterase 13